MYATLLTHIHCIRALANVTILKPFTGDVFYAPAKCDNNKMPCVLKIIAEMRHSSFSSTTDALRHWHKEARHTVIIKCVLKWKLNVSAAAHKSHGD